ncbi:MAG TPA: hypothetical protein VF808_16095 [Ktedonobacterales bacterium]
MSDGSVEGQAAPFRRSASGSGGWRAGLARFERRKAVRRVVAVALPLVILTLLIGIWPAYTVAGMDWTGFSGNTVWDWVQLLAAPVVLSGGTIWFTRGEESTPLKDLWRDVSRGRLRSVWRVLWSGAVRVEDLMLFYVSFVVLFALILLIIAVLLILPAYAFHLTWTGYLSGEQPDYTQPKRLWDWLTALMLPLALATATIRLHAHHRAITRRGAESSEDPGAQGAKGGSEPS